LAILKALIVREACFADHSVVGAMLPLRQRLRNTGLSHEGVAFATTQSRLTPFDCLDRFTSKWSVEVSAAPEIAFIASHGSAIAGVSRDLRLSELTHTLSNVQLSLETDGRVRQRIFDYLSDRRSVLNHWDS
jgi:hypothetical protein